MNEDEIRDRLRTMVEGEEPPASLGRVVLERSRRRRRVAASAVPLFVAAVVVVALAITSGPDRARQDLPVIGTSGADSAFGRYFFTTPEPKNGGVVELSDRDGSACLTLTGASFHSATVTFDGRPVVRFTAGDINSESAYCKQVSDPTLLEDALATTDALELSFEGGTFAGATVPLMEMKDDRLQVHRGKSTDHVDVTRSAPRSDCEIGIVRASWVPVSDLHAVTDGLLPTWLPSGFGLLRVFGPGDGAQANIFWADDRCRIIEMLVFPHSASSVPKGPGVGGWTLIGRSPRGCSNPQMGRGRCLDYTRAVAGHKQLTLQMMGLSRREGDRVAFSLAP